MNPSAVNVAVVDGKTITEAVDISIAQGKPVKIKAIQGGKYILAEGEKGIAPENITVKRVGKDLHLSLEGSDEPQLIIEGFYEVDGQLVGLAEDGSYYEYIASDAERDHEAAFLMDDGSSALVLGSDQLVGFGNGLVAAAGVAWFMPALLGLGALGLAGLGFAIGKGGDDGGNDGGGVRVAVPKKPDAVGATDDVGAVTGPITKGGVTDDKSPTFSGSGGQPGNTIEIIDNGKKIGEVVVKDDGTWTFTPVPPLTEGAHNIVVVEKGPGGTSEPSDGFDFVVDTVAPGKSSINDAQDDVGAHTGTIARDGGLTDDARPTLSGKGEPGTHVDVYANGEKIGSALVQADGTWSFTPATDLPVGKYEFTTVAVDAAGNAGLPSDPYIIEVIALDTKAPDKGVIEAVTDNSGDKTGPIDNGGMTDDGTPTFSGGNLVPGDTVTIIDNNTGLPIGSTVVKDDGSWEFTPETALPEGPNEIVVVVTDPAGNEGAPSDPWVVVVDTLAPIKPSIGDVLDNQGDTQGSIVPGTTTDDAQPEFSGIAEEGSIVYIYDNKGTTPIGSAIAGAGGEWSFIPVPPLPAGPHEITVVAKDAAGNLSEPSDPFQFEVVTGGMPSAPSISGITDNVGDNAGSNISPISGITDDLRPTVHGTAEPGSTVSVFANGQLIGTVIADATTGVWSLVPDRDLDQGLNNITASSVNAAGNVGVETGAYPITVDTLAPGAATQVLLDDVGAIRRDIQDGDVTDDSTPTFSGTAEPGSVVLILDKGQVIGSAPVDAQGNWSWAPAPALPDGRYALSTIVQDAAGNQGAESPVINFQVDTRAVVISIEYASDNVGGVQDPLSSGDVTDDKTPTLHGEATPGATVNIYLGGKLVGTATANGLGEWFYTHSPDLEDGSYSFFATVTTPAGGESDPTATFNLVVDATPPDVSEPGQPGGIGDILDDVGTEQGSIADGGITDDNQPTLVGSGREPGEIVHIFQDGQEVGSVVVNDKGEWSFTPSTALNDGTYDYTLKIEDAAGNLSAESTDPYTITVDTAEPVQPTLDSIWDDQGDTTGNLIGLVSPITDDAQPLLGGTGEAGSIIYIYDNGSRKPIGSALVQANGTWEYLPVPPLPNGPHQLHVESVDAAGNVSDPSPSFDFTVVTGGAATAPAITSVTDNVGDNAGSHVPKDTGVTDDKRPVISGTAEPGAIVTVYINDVPAGTAIARADGTWDLTPNIDLTEGLNNISAEAENAAGNISPETGDYTITLDTTAPAPVSAESLSDDVGAITGPITDGDTTDDNTPTFSGQAGAAEAGSIVYVYDNKGINPIGSAVVQANGSWSFTPAPALPDGPHSLHTVVKDAAGNESAPSTAIGFNVDTSAVVISIDYISDNEGLVQGDLANPGLTDDTTPTLHGKATPGAYVIIYLDGVPQGTATVRANGEWDYTQTPELTADQVYKFTASVVTAAGGESTQTPVFLLTLDTTAPVVTPPGQPGGIGDILDDVGNPQGSIGDGGITDDNNPTLVGSGREPGEVVHILQDGQEIGSVVANSLGEWSFTPQTSLNDGTYDFNIIVEDAAGNFSDPSTDPYTITVDTKAPVAPTLDSVFDDQGDVQGNLIGETNPATDDDQPTMTGTAEPDSVVYITDTVNGVVTVLGSVTVDAAGAWTFTPNPALPAGAHQISVQAKDAAGNLSAASAAFDFTVVAAGAPAAPAITGVTDNVGANAGDNISPGTGITDDKRPVISGTAEPGAIITVYINDVPAGTAIARANGTWDLTPNIDLTEGLNNISAQAENAAGNISPETGDYTITLDTTAPAPVSAESLSDDVGAITGPITDGDTTDDNTPTFSGQAGAAEAGSIVYVYDNKGIDPIGSAVVQANGSWSFTPTPALPDGPHSLHTVVKDAAGNESAPSTAIGFNVDTSAVVISIDYISDNEGLVQGDLANPGLTDDTTPTLHGKATPGAYVIIYLDGVPQGTATVRANGEWDYTQTPELTADQVYKFTASVVTAAGGESTQTPVFLLTLDTTAPVVTPPGQPGGIGDILDDVGIEQGSIGPGGVTDDTTPTLTGTGQTPGDIVHIKDGTEIGTAIVDANGDWSFTPKTPRVEGKHDFTIIVEDQAGNLSDESDPYTIIIDITAPNAPTLDSLLDDLGDVQGNLIGQTNPVTDDDLPVMSGTAEPGSVVYITDTVNGVAKVIGSATVDATGAWNFTPNPALPAGAHQITVQAKDAAGNLSAASVAFDFTVVAAGAPVAPAITGVTDNVGDNAGDNVSPGTGVTDDKRPVISGTAEPGSTVTVYFNGVAVGSITADTVTGAWSLTPTADLTEGQNSITAKAVNAAGNISPPTGDYNVTLDTTAPNPTTSSLTDDVGAVTGAIVDGTTTDDNRPTFTGNAGTGEAGSIVYIYDKVPQVNPIGSAVVGADGSWNFTPGSDLPDGDYSFSAIVVDAAGNEGAPTDPVDFTVDTRPVVVSINAASDNVGPVQGVLETGDTTDDTTPTLTGKATPNTYVNIYLDGVPQGTATVLSNGEWTYTQAPALTADQLYRFTASVVTPGGGESAQTPAFELILDTTPPVVTPPGQPGGIGDVLDNIGNANGATESIADGGVTNDTAPEITGTGRTVGDIVYIRRDGVEVGSALVGGTGTWSFTDAGLINGMTYGYTIAVRDAAGNLSGWSTDAYDITIDTTAPGKPTITSVADNVGSNQGNLSYGDVTDDNTPTFTGLAEAGSTVYLYDNNGTTSIGSAIADANGVWTYTSVLSRTSHSITVKASDAAGNLGDASDPFVFFITAANTSGSEAFNSIGPGRIDFVDGVEYTFDSSARFSSVVGADGVARTESYAQGFGGHFNYLVLGGSAVIKVDIPGVANKVSFDYTPTGGGYVEFFTDSGSSLGTVNFNHGGNSQWDQLNFSSDNIGYFILHGWNNTDGGSGLFFDDIAWGNNARDLRSGDDEVYELQDNGDLTALSLSGDEDVFDLSQWNSGGGHAAVNVVDLSVSGNQTIKLSIEDVLSASKTNLFHDSDMKQLMINGNEGDVVDLQGLLGNDDPGQWLAQGQITAGGKVYEVYQHSAGEAELLIEQGVQTNLV